MIYTLIILYKIKKILNRTIILNYNLFNNKKYNKIYNKIYKKIYNKINKNMNHNKYKNAYNNHKKKVMKLYNN